MTVYDVTREWTLASRVVDIKDILKDVSQAKPGSSKYHALQIDGLGDRATNHDCVWEITVSLDNDHAEVRLHGLQTLFFHRV
jgi:hypothetical protein